MKRFLLAVLALLLPLSGWVYAADLHKGLGSWIASPALGDGCGWRQTDTDLRFLICPTIGSEPYQITRTEPLPDGDWTMNIWIQSVGQHDGLSIVTMDPDGSRRMLIAKLDGPMRPGLPVQWVRIACSPAKGRYVVIVNGTPTFKSQADGAVLPRGQISFLLQGSNWDRDKPEAIRVLSVNVTSGADVDTNIAGPAFKGWSTVAQADSLKNIRDLNQRLDEVCASATTDIGRSYGLAAKMVADYALGGSISPSAWSQLSALIEQLLPRDRSGLATALPIAAACGSESQKEQVKVWATKFFDVKYLTQWRDMHATIDTAEKAILLDPVRVTEMGQPLGYRTIGYWIDALKQTAPQYSLMPLTVYLGNENWKMDAVAWMLPVICSASSDFGKYAIDAVKAFREKPNHQPGEPDRALSFAAYRLAEVAPEASAEFLSLIAHPDVKADAMELISNKLSESQRLDPDRARAVEQLLKESIAQWKPTASRTAPIAEMMRLVKFYDSQHQSEKSAKALADAVAAIGGLSGTGSPGDIVEIARHKRRLKSTDNQAWWDKAIAVAESADQSMGNSDSSGGGIYVSRLLGMVRDLVKEDKLDEALAIVKRMDPVRMSNNKAMALDSVISKILHADTKAAIDLLDEYPDTSAKSSTTGRIAAKVSQTDLQGALDLLKTIPEAGRIGALLQILRDVRADQSDAVVGLLKNAISASARPANPYSLSHGFGGGIADRYSFLPPDRLLALSEAFKGSQDMYAVYLLSCIVRSCGLDSDPIWLQFSGATRTQGVRPMIPWGSDRLRYAVTAE